MNAIDHLGSIVSAYAVTGVVLVTMVAAVLLDGRAQRRLLVRLERRGSTREALRRQANERP